MYFWDKVTAAAFMLILGMTSTTLTDVPRCEVTGCPNQHACVAQAANATHPAHAHCLRVCHFIAVTCVDCPPESPDYTCKAVGRTCQNTRAICIPKNALAHEY